MEENFSLFDWGDLASAEKSALAIPKHRIEYFKIDERIVWRKADRIDDVFGSTGSGKTIVDVLNELDEAAANEGINGFAHARTEEEEEEEEGEEKGAWDFEQEKEDGKEVDETLDDRSGNAENVMEGRNDHLLVEEGMERKIEFERHDSEQSEEDIASCINQDQRMSPSSPASAAASAEVQDEWNPSSNPACSASVELPKEQREKKRDGRRR